MKVASASLARRWLVVAGGLSLVTLLLYDVGYAQALLREYVTHTFFKTTPFVVPPFKFTSDPTFRPSALTSLSVSDPTTTHEHCRVQFVFAGTKYDYNQFPSMQSWIRMADARCEIAFMRPYQPFLAHLAPAEKAMFDDTAYLPILQADLMKLLVLYYRGGLVTDLDVEARKPFPANWTGPTTLLATCDVVLGIEVQCFDAYCAKTMARKGQIQNWSMWARRRHSVFLGQLIEYVVAKYKLFPSHDPDVAVQEVAGSGTITDFVQLYGDFDGVPFYKVPTTLDNRTLASDWASILRIHKAAEEVCVLGPMWTGGQCGGHPKCLLSHKYEGSWRQPAVKTEWDN
ncbi:Aste57867_15119 [Aphanomyces stellatus]|uniref:Aste57867_15119 protein n=1 Tax=Aphanomyces stellatus TaxID=120398 RepID=A0A485L301_9STRA|nr:hypothetical protein As57867_015063 [Aphanomyces stellatus]VFT91929.1 Aste57867_15119 [Aphanomyces stellatus]